MKKRLPYPFLKERLIKLNSITEIEIQITYNTVPQYNQSQHLVIKKAIDETQWTDYAGVLRDKTMDDKLIYNPMMINKITPSEDSN